MKRRLERWGWLVRVEVSFSHFGERGRIDLLAFHPATLVLLVIELKSELVDVQALLGSLDAKVRLAPGIAARFGWSARATLPAIVFLEDRTTRNRLMRFDPLFARFDVLGRAALSWLRQPTTPTPSGLLWLTQLHGARRSPVPAHRVRFSKSARPRAQ